MIFIETSVFTRQVQALLTDDEYADLQRWLVANPEAGDVIKDTGGLRKVRWALDARGKGKRGGVRVICFHVNDKAQIRMLLIYSKGVKDDLSAAEKRVLKAINEGWK
jgi:hypothetical protein